MQLPALRAAAPHFHPDGLFVQATAQRPDIASVCLVSRRTEHSLCPCRADGPCLELRSVCLLLLRIRCGRFRGTVREHSRSALILRWWHSARAAVDAGPGSHLPVSQKYAKLVRRDTERPYGQGKHRSPPRSGSGEFGIRNHFPVTRAGPQHATAQWRAPRQKKVS